MLFNSIEFAYFLPIVFIIYWFFSGKSNQNKNFILMISSYTFYAFWDWRFLFLLMFSTLLDYASGVMINRSDSKKWAKFWLILSVVINLGFLGFFKYYNFFVESFAEFLTALGFQAHMTTINVILPVGISFYTFHGLSYVFDIYNKKIAPEYNFIRYSLFVSFFPLLVAGPIERATHLLPQLKKDRKFDYQLAKEGLRQMLWGFFKKMVVADNCAVFANQIFNTSEDQSGSMLVMGALFFAFQIYGDFSGYTDIATGTAKLFGIKLLPNFRFPYFSRDIAEFWRRWHISLSSWFKDYLYIPLGGSRGSMWMKIRNTFIIFLVSGFWHGANWTFIAWGALNAFYFLPLLITKRNRKNMEIIGSSSLPSDKSGSIRRHLLLNELPKVIITFSLTTFAWIFFRAESISHALQFIQGIFNFSLFSMPVISSKIVFTFFFVFIMLLFEWFNRQNEFGIQQLLEKYPRIFRWLVYVFIIFLIISFGNVDESFIYFQF